MDSNPVHKSFTWGCEKVVCAGEAIAGLLDASGNEVSVYRK